MVDEVAWGVGWGAEGDDATPTETPEDSQLQSKGSSSRSRSRPQIGDIAVPPGIDWQQDGPRSMPSQDAASRRSTSRTKRSLSRAPTLTDRSLSSRGQSRSVSRHPRGFSPAPSRSREPLPPVTMTSPVSASSSDAFNPMFKESAPVSSPSPIQRGRRQNKYSHFNSRSPSPSMVPTTPLDGVAVIPPDTLLEQPEDLHLDGESSRGRATLRSPLGSDKPNQSSLRFEERLSDWTSQESELELGRDLSSIAFVSRNEDVLLDEPPVKSTMHHDFSRRQRPFSTSPIAGDRLQPNTKITAECFLNNSPPSISTAANMMLRSRSAEIGHR